MNVVKLATLMATFGLSVGYLSAANSSFTVPGTADPFLAGMPNGSSCCGGDSAPAESPILVSGLSVSGGEVLTFTNVTGGMGNEGAPSSNITPDGVLSALYPSGPANGIGGYIAPIDALVGVFLDNNLPTASAAPATLDYSAIGTSLSSFSPLLKQVFFIGDGLTGTGTGSVQSFVVPDGATRLFLGDVDGYGWYNNGGSVSGTVVAAAAGTATPEPATGGLLTGCAIGFLGVLFRRKYVRSLMPF